MRFLEFNHARQRQSVVPESEALSGWRAAVWLVIATLLIYAQTVTFQFLEWDDHSFVTQNDYVRHGLTVPGLAWLPTGIVAYGWHPLTNLSLMLDSTLYAGWAGGFHLSNTLLHAANAVLAWLFMRKLTGRNRLAFLVALLFAVHPLRVESVAWISERKDVLFGFFALLAAIAYCDYSAARGYRRYAYVTLAVLAAALSKSIAVVLPLLLGLIDFYRYLARGAEPAASAATAPPPGLGTLALEKLPWLVITMLPAYWMLHNHQSAGAVLTPFSGGVIDRVAFVFLALSEYLRLTIWPSDLRFLHSMWRDYSANAAIAGMAVVAAVSALCWRLRRSCPEALFGWLWFLASLLPAAGIVRVGHHSVAERFTYIPHIGLMLAAAALGGIVLARAKLRPVWLIPGLLILGFSAVSATYAWTWRNTQSMYERALSVEPMQVVARTALADVLARSGRRAEAVDFLEPLRAAPASWNDGETAFMLAKAYSRLNQEEWADQWFARSAELSPQLAVVWMDRANHSLLRKRYAAAAEYYETSLRLRPDFKFALVGLGYSLFYLGRTSEAIRALARAAEIDPEFAEPHFHLGFIAEASGRPEEARKHYTNALERNHRYAAARRRLERLDGAEGLR